MTDTTDAFDHLPPSERIRAALSDLTGAAIRVEEALFALDNKDGRRLLDECRRQLRPLIVTDVLRGMPMVAVSGPQGVGKTSIVQELYGLEEWLAPDMGQGELVPVFVIEDAEVTEPAAYLVRFDDLVGAQEDRFVLRGKPADAEEFAEALRGEREDVLYPAIRVPMRYFDTKYSGGAGLLLLPGYEKLDESSATENRLAQAFMRQALTTASAVLLVTGVSNMATTDAAEAMRDLRERFLDGAGPLIVVNGCTDPDGDPNALVAERTSAAEAFGTSPDRVACVWSTGLSLDVGEVDAALRRVDPGDGAGRAVRSRTLEKLVRENLGDLFDRIALEAADEMERLLVGDDAQAFRTTLELFDEAARDLRTGFQTRLDRALLQAASTAGGRANRLLGNERESFEDRKRIATETNLWLKQGEIATARHDLVTRAWHGDDVGGPSQMASVMPTLIGELTSSILTVYGVSELVRTPGGQRPTDSGDPAIGRALTMLLTGSRPAEGDPPSREALRAAVQLLPAVALEWASLAAAQPSMVGLDPRTLEPVDDDVAGSTLSDVGAHLRNLTAVQADIVRSLATIAGLDATNGSITSLPALMRAVRGSTAVAVTAASRVTGGVAAAMIGLAVFDTVRNRMFAERRMVFDALHRLEQAERDVRMTAFDELIAQTRKIVRQAGRRAYHLDAAFGNVEWLQWAVEQARHHRRRLLEVLGAGLDPLG